MELWYALPALALVAGAAALVPLGQQVLQRGVVFIDLAVAQAAAAAALWSMGWVGHEVDWASDLAGLAGALLVGAGVATSLAWALDVPALGVHHLEGHLLSPMLAEEAPPFPFVALLVSVSYTHLTLPTIYSV